MMQLNENKISELLASYPRVRPPLTDAHKAVYVDEYKINRGGEGWLYRIVQLLEVWGHRRVATIDNDGPILEIGAGSLNHIPYEPDAVAYDCIEPFEALYKDSPLASSVRNIYGDISDIPSGQRYGRVLSIAVLEHLTALPMIVASAGGFLQSNGVFQAVVPSEGGFLWGASWRMSTGVAYRLRTGLDYKILMRHEHINRVQEIIDIIAYFFESVSVRRFPLPFHHLSLDTYIEARNCNQSRCRAYLNGLQAGSK